MKIALWVVFAAAALSTGLRLVGVLSSSTLIPAVALGAGMILLMLNVVGESDRKY